MELYLYKGLKKPLVLFGLKNKYIIYAFGAGALGIIGLAVLPSFIGLFLGIIIGGAIGGAGIWYTFYLQDNKGLYQKQKNNEEIHIFPRRFKLKNMKTR